MLFAQRKTESLEGFVLSFFEELLDAESVPGRQGPRLPTVDGKRLAEALDDTLACPDVVEPFAERLRRLGSLFDPWLKDLEVHVPFLPPRADEVVESIRRFGFTKTLSAVQDRVWFDNVMRRLIVDWRVFQHVEQSIFAVESLPTFWEVRYFFPDVRLLDLAAERGESGIGSGSRRVAVPFTIRTYEDAPDKMTVRFACPREAAGRRFDFELIRPDDPAMESLISGQGDASNRKRRSMRDLWESVREASRRDSAKEPMYVAPCGTLDCVVLDRPRGFDLLNSILLVAVDEAPEHADQ